MALVFFAIYIITLGPIWAFYNRIALNLDLDKGTGIILVPLWFISWSFLLSYYLYKKFNRTK